MDKYKSKSPLSILIAVMILLGCMAMGSTNADALEVAGENTGLRIKVSDVLVETDNLGPGDTKSSTMTIFIDPESETSSLRVWLKAEIYKNVLGKEVNGKRGNLDDRLILTITHENGKELHKGPISKLNKNVLVGDIQKGTPVNLTFTVHLPGEATGNEYQGASLKVRWILTAQYERKDSEPDPTRPLSRPTDSPRTTIQPQPPSAGPTDPAAPPKQDSDTPSGIPEIIEIEDEEIPEGPPGGPETLNKPGEGETEIIIIKEEEIPKGLPKTGEMPPIIYYGLGAVSIFAGIMLNRRKHKQ